LTAATAKVTAAAVATYLKILLFVEAQEGGVAVMSLQKDRSVLG
jgi:hypothetical protein